MRNEESANFPFDDLLQDAMDERKLKRFVKKIKDKRSELNESGNS
jgi:hypothetical protein